MRAEASAGSRTVRPRCSGGRRGDSGALESRSHSTAWYYILEHAASPCTRYFECCLHHLWIYLGSVIEHSRHSRPYFWYLSPTEKNRHYFVIKFTRTSVDFVDVQTIIARAKNSLRISSTFKFKSEAMNLASITEISWYFIHKVSVLLNIFTRDHSLNVQCNFMKYPVAQTVYILSHVAEYL